MTQTTHHVRELRGTLKQLEAQGWTITLTKRGHVQCAPPDKTKGVVVLATSGDARALKNGEALLRRAGAILK